MCPLNCASSVKPTCNSTKYEQENSRFFSVCFWFKTFLPEAVGSLNPDYHDEILSAQ